MSLEVASCVKVILTLRTTPLQAVETKSSITDLCHYCFKLFDSIPEKLLFSTLAGEEDFDLPWVTIFEQSLYGSMFFNY